jgi:hydroxypyruvate reductase
MIFPAFFARRLIQNRRYGPASFPAADYGAPCHFRGKRRTLTPLLAEMTMPAATLAEIAVALWWEGVRAVDGRRAVTEVLQAHPVPRPDRIVAVGKAAVPMCAAAVGRFGPGIPALAITKTGHGADNGAHPPFEVIEAAHPVPDASSLRAGARLLQAVMCAGAGDHLLLLVSGGASALVEAPAPGVTLEDIARLNRELLASGLDIAAMNRRRREVSRIKGGGLLAGFPGASVTVLAISDVAGDALMTIGSGIGAAPQAHAFAYNARIVASNAIAREAAARAAQAHGLTVLTNSETLYHDVMQDAAEVGRALRNSGRGVHIWGGEPTVVLPPDPGSGGRNQALALALAREISGRPGIAAVVGGTDGSDGPTTAAGGVIDGDTWLPTGENALIRADSGTFLRSRGALFETGPTGTNVMDLLVAVCGGISSPMP